MSKALELELTYLAASIPPGLEACAHKSLSDMYFPTGAPIPKLRIRRQDDNYQLTKKTLVDPHDVGNQKEENITLTAEEYEALAEGDGRNISKTRYYLPYGEYLAEIDIFTDTLAGLVVIEFEFATLAEKQAFVMPDFCLTNVTQENFIAGGALAGKTYTDIEVELSRFGYKPLTW